MQYYVIFHNILLINYILDLVMNHYQNHWWPSSMTNMDGLVRDCSNSIANALELLQSRCKAIDIYLTRP